MPNLLSFGLNILADIFYPKYCFGCRRPGHYLCKFCMSQIPGIAQSFCVACNAPSPGGWTHEKCRQDATLLGANSKPSPNLLPDRLLSAFPYQYSVIADMLITGKYYFIPEVFAILGALATDFLLLQNPPKGFVICAIPLHPQRQRWRGFNQSKIAAKIIAQGLQLPYYPLLVRTKNTQTQKNLDVKARQSNMQNAFSCPRTPPLKILLIDDVTTTGKTFLEATRALKQAGAKEVWCISIAKD